MNGRVIPRRFQRGLHLGIAVMLLSDVVGCQSRAPGPTSPPVKSQSVPLIHHVHPGEDLAAALAALEHHNGERELIVHAGTYAPRRPGFAFLVMTAAHDGVRLRAEGDVTLTAGKMTVAGSEKPDALVSHVLYCGDGVGPDTLIEGFRITGARGRVETNDFPTEWRAAPAGPLQRGLFYTRDGGGMKIFGDSAPTIRRCLFIDNETTLCGGAVSVEQQGFRERGPRFEDCRFENNRCPGTGSAVDILSGSTAEIVNCLFLNNVANYGMQEIERRFGLSYNPEHGCGALTVFPGSSAVVRRCTFTGNWNGVDDHGKGSIYEECLFWMNDRSDGSRPGRPYDIDVIDAAGVQQCRIPGMDGDLRGTINRSQNEWSTADPDFDADYQPQNALDADRGYRLRSPNSATQSERPSS